MPLIQQMVVIAALLVVATLMLITACAPARASQPRDSAATTVLRVCKFGPYWSRSHADKKARTASEQGCNPNWVFFENGGWYVYCVPAPIADRPCPRRPFSRASRLR